MNFNDKTKGFKITWDPDFQDEKFEITTSLKAQFETLHMQAINPNDTSIIEKLIQLIIQHPHTPILKNFLTVAYHSQKQVDKCNEVNNWMLKEHPDYLFAIINKAYEHIYNKNFQEAEKLLGEDFHLELLFPNRKLFHGTEVTGYYKATVLFFASVGDFYNATERLKIIQELAPEHQDTLKAEEILQDFIDNEPKSWLMEQMDRSIKPIVTKKLSDNKYVTPKFNHKEIVALYKYHFDLPVEIIREIIQLPRKTLIEDLETVIKDSEFNFKTYSNRDTSFDENSFLVHALFLLNEINAVESLPTIFSILENNDDYLDFYFDDCLLIFMWQPIFGLAKTQLELLIHFLCLSGISPKAKICVLAAMEQFVYHKIYSKENLLVFYERIIDVHLTSKPEDNIVDSDFLAFIVCDCSAFKFESLLPKIKQLYKNDWISIYIAGEFKEIKKEIKKKFKTTYKQDLLNIFEIYDQELKNIDDHDYEYTGFEDDFEDDLANSLQDGVGNTAVGKKFASLFEQSSQSEKKPIIQLPKINRNDACPCGSGKKFKKCCINT